MRHRGFDKHERTDTDVSSVQIILSVMFAVDSASDMIESVTVDSAQEGGMSCYVSRFPPT